ncbi:hypothetical protein GLAREA_12163 [Glarea lozoyensis ATCC 20868]|uniref:F-box domain-containing protein n=1 Tax=Glarea lozoyensis (strain ATCC 20868 / MF5171) TaxID=1116229 RepID=S3DJ65_GLAL2|nr:uncharacterized protein GLAREA_12163 [Glarea lozoyensis ATCC 20868]EPE32081.1 hypothetical protein GLAREA_12163 [Glarea lozoyensis ATCC 20868]
MPNLVDLPYEVIASILRNLDNVRDLLPCLLTCQHVHTTFKEYPMLKEDIFRRQVIPTLLPYSIALVKASHLPVPHTSSSIQALLATLYDEPGQLVTLLNTMPLSDFSQMGHIHDVIESLAISFANDSWALQRHDDPSLPDDLVLSEKEHFRFCRAFYRAQLFFNLFPGTEDEPYDTAESRDVVWFLSMHAPWENEQLSCVQDYLQEIFFKASFDVIAHDVHYGGLEIDYLSRDFDNFSMQRLISRGLAFIHRVVLASSYEEKYTLISGEMFTKDGANLSDAFQWRVDNRGVEKTLDEYTEQEIQALVPRIDPHDTDQGPFKAWRLVHGDLPHDCWVSHNDTSGLRERAYVMWDLDRLENHNLLATFPNVPEATEKYTDEEYDNMQESFKIRDDIWEAGGMGYWSKDDTSKIVTRTYLTGLGFKYFPPSPEHPAGVTQRVEERVAGNTEDVIVEKMPCSRTTEAA